MSHKDRPVFEAWTHQPAVTRHGPGPGGGAPCAAGRRPAQLWEALWQGFKP